MKRAALVITLLCLTASAPAMAADPTYREGVISHMGPGFADDYLALPVDRGTTVKLCGPARCLVMTSNDFGPNQRVHPDRIADVSVSTFEYLCDCPSSIGLMRGSWRVVDAVDELPATDTLP